MKRNLYNPFFISWILTFTILAKIIYVRALLFDNIDILQSVYLELGFIIVMVFFIALIRKSFLRNTLYVLLNIIISFILLSILIYEDYFGYIVNIRAVSQLNQVGTIKDSIIELISLRYLFVFVDLLVVVPLLVKQTINKTKNKVAIKYYMACIMFGLFLSGFHVLTNLNVDIASTKVAAEKQGVFTYQLLAIIDKIESEEQPTRALAQEEIEALQNEINKVKGVVDKDENELKLHASAEGKNLIVIQAEAFQNFVVNLEIDGQEITPYLNELIKESIYFNNVYQQIGPGNTSDAEFVSNTSIYPDAWSASSEIYGERSIPSLPKLLGKSGYESYTFHANDVTFWNRNNLYPALGFSEYYDINFFGEEDIIGIGPSDEVAYNAIFDELNNKYQKGVNFYAQFVTLTSHHPFVIPDEKDVIDLPSSYDGTLLGDYLKSLNYLDRQTEKFVNRLKEADMWQDTLLVFYGDHFGLQPNSMKEQDFTLLKEILNRDYTYLDQFNIPLIITNGGENIGQVNNNLGGQIDILPTITNMLGLDLSDYIHFGQDLVNQESNLIGIRYYMPYGSFLNEDISFKPAEGFMDGEALSIETKQVISEFEMHEEDYNRINKLFKLSDDYVKSLPSRIR